MTVTLIGMPAVGKSSLGKAVARKLGLRFVDPDKVIEERYGKQLQDIIDIDGIERFKEIEQEVLLTLDLTDAVIAPGGSAVYYERAMTHLKSAGPVIYLSASLKTIKKRLGDYSSRGVVLSEGQTIDDLYYERLPLFKKYADYTVNCNTSAYNRFRAEIIDILSECK